MGGIISDIVDGIVSAAFNWLSSIMEKRGLIQQGRQQQHSDDLQSSVQEGQDAAKTTETVRADSDSQLNAGLEQLRRDAASGNG